MFKEKDLKTDQRRPFQIVIGLKEGYGSGIVHSVDDVRKIIKSWMIEALGNNQPTITGGILIPGTALYAWNSGATGVMANEEETLLFIGEINPLYNADMTDDQAVKCLKSLATRLGEKLNQTRMYVSYRDTIRIYQNDGQVHPTGT